MGWYVREELLWTIEVEWTFEVGWIEHTPETARAETTRSYIQWGYVLLILAAVAVIYKLYYT